KSAIPYPRLYAMRPSLLTATTHPGESGLSQGANWRSTATASFCESAAMAFEFTRLAASTIAVIAEKMYARIPSASSRGVQDTRPECTARIYIASGVWQFRMCPARNSFRSPPQRRRRFACAAMRRRYSGPETADSMGGFRKQSAPKGASNGRIYDDHQR